MFRIFLITVFSLIIYLNSTYAYSNDIVSVVSNKNSDTDDKLSELRIRSIFIMAARYWENGVPIQIVLMEQDKITHKVFVSTVLGMSVDRYASIVNAKVSSGLSRPPIKVSSQIKMIDTINKISGAIGYVSPGYIIYKDQYENIKFISIEADYE